MERMVATRRFRYADTMLEPGEHFFAAPSKAKILRTLNRAMAAPQTAANAPPESVDTNAASAAEDLSALRAEYHTASGKRAYHGWDADTLRDKIAGYHRRDMRAED